MSAPQVAAASRAVADRFFRELDLDAVNALSTFIRIAKFNEIDTSTIYYRVWKERPWIRTFAPRIDLESGAMVNISLFPDTPLVENRWGLREPVDGETIDANDLDLVIVPLLAVDRTGHRVGYGKGFYDRFLSKCRGDCLKVGLNYFPPLDEDLAAESHDIALDLCITPDGTYRF